MKAVCIAGWSDSGKTTLIEQLIPLLMDRGLRVGVVKHTHHSLSMDQHGSDTDRYRGSGAAAVVLAAPDGTALLDSRPMNLAQTLALASRMDTSKLDLILVEGFDREAHLPTLEVWRTQDVPFRSREEWRCAVITDLPCETKLPVFSPSDIDAIADFIGTLL